MLRAAARVKLPKTAARHTQHPSQLHAYTAATLHIARCNGSDIAPLSKRFFQRRVYSQLAIESNKMEDESLEEFADPNPSRIEHAVISTFDLFSIGLGPSSSHTVGPLRAAKIFIQELQELGLLSSVHTLKITLYGSLAATGKGHMTPQALMMGFEGSDPETIDTGTVGSRYDTILNDKILILGGVHRIEYDMDRDMVWRWDQVLPTHPNGMRFSVFNVDGDLLATNEYFSVGGGFVVNEKTKVDENLFYKGVDKSQVSLSRLSQNHGLGSTPLLGAPGSEDAVKDGKSSLSESETRAKTAQPSYLFHSGASLLSMARKHNLTIAQLVYENELAYYTHDEIHGKLMKIWGVMDNCIRSGVSSPELELPGRLRLKRRAPMLFYPALYTPTSNPSISSPVENMPLIVDAHATINSNSARAENLSDPPKVSPYGEMAVPTMARTRPPRVMGRFDHPLPPMPPRKALFPGVDFLSCYAIAVNEVNASGGRIVTSPTNGAAGVIPAVLKYIVEFLSDDPQRDISTFLLTAAAIGMLFKRGSTISAAEGKFNSWCQAEVGVACSMAGFSACMGASPEIILQSAEIGIEHNLGLTCDPIDGLVQVPCIERNSLGASQLAMASDGVHSVTLDEAIAAMRMTAQDMSEKYKETSLGGLATTVRIPLTSPAW
ncbi:serine dehydratase alpha chain-domain-containing protein [Cantharellus anzutake]|uniref:serine dehydratase alpha chain-domain-containing protein n=1 Tax=Cantharellus anzutake TaxID=1750568 RepID=UPI0019050345|nr:serine dehydratase alpha chain-domain-containing protein [Cantharellus anzutake]KAF8325870.1 serine dehydratase alpha chain-domain-containing protein [Cantharellus anzutake]